MESPKNVHETIGETKAIAKAAHDRIDKLETGLRDDLKGIMEKLGTIEQWMHRKQGYEAAMYLVASVIGGAISFLIKQFISGGS